MGEKRDEVVVCYKGAMCKGRCLYVGAVRYIAMSSGVFAQSNYPSKAIVRLLTDDGTLRCRVKIRYFVCCDCGIALLEEIRESECGQVTTTYENKHCDLTQCLFFQIVVYLCCNLSGSGSLVLNLFFQKKKRRKRYGS